MDKFLSDAVKHWKTEVNRNTFDKSKKHFASYNFGKLYPMFVQHCQPNETIKIRPSMVFDLEPMTHELYNDIKCNTAWFKVNTRSIWPNFRKFARLDPTKPSSSIVHPFISRSENICTVGSLANHLGVPVTTYGVFDGNSTSSFQSSTQVNDFGNSVDYNPFAFPGDVASFQPFVERDLSTLDTLRGGLPCFLPLVIPATLNGGVLTPSFGRDARNSLQQFLNAGRSSLYKTLGIIIGSGLQYYISDNCVLYLPHIGDLSSSFKLRLSVFAGSDLMSSTFRNSITLSYTASGVSGWTLVSKRTTNVFSPIVGNVASAILNTSDIKCILTSDFISSIQNLQKTESFVTICITADNLLPDSLTNNSFSYLDSFAGTPFISDSENKTLEIVPGFYGYPRYSSVQEVNQVENTPFAGTTPTLPLNALPFRAYRSIYNSHFRDKIHDPFRDGNGDIYVDQYVENLGDGADSTTPVDFEYCRFEPDLFNTCLPTPTMGDNVERPLVGITVGANPTSATLNYNADGEAYSIDVNFHHTSNGTDVIDDVQTATHSEDNDNLTYLTLKDAIQYGISLQDLQNVRALTKWYEASYRGKGRFEYDKFVEAHFGKQPSLRENLAPEYLGGDTVYINSMKVVNQTASNDSKPLGSTGGMANFQSKNDSISVFCDEDCYIMGIVWFTVDNVNSQSLDPMWLLSQPSDYATPEFADLGVMPIYNKFVAPLQCPVADLNKVFGYQRMYGDKLYSFDTVAGDFLTMKSDYLMQRRFNAMPTLTADLSKMHPEDFTNIFCFDTSYDKIYGRWYFDVTLSTWLQQTPNAQII